MEDSPVERKHDNHEKVDINKNQKDNKSEYVTRWISQTEFDDSSSVASSSLYSSSVVESEDYVEEMKNFNLSNNVAGKNTGSVDLRQNVNVLQHIFNTKNSVQTFGTVNIEQSSGIHIGNVTYVTGPIHITNGRNIDQAHDESAEGIKITTVESASNTKPDRNININISSNIIESYGANISSPSRLHISTIALQDEAEEEEILEINRKEAFVGNIARNIIGSVLKIVNRRTWLAQQPLEAYETLEEPVPFVIISHTATELTRTQAETIYLVRHIQCFHIESCRKNDISYNFLVGGDGNVYEGRSWGVVGAHTSGYNKKAIGISFIGCFMKELPPKESLEACKLLVKKGVELGHIHPNYKLLAHCQCCPTESPGRKLFEELQNWPHFSVLP